MLSFQQPSSTLLEEVDSKEFNRIVNNLITKETLLESSPFMNIMPNPATVNHYYEILQQYENRPDDLDNLLEKIVNGITQQLFQRYCLIVTTRTPSLLSLFSAAAHHVAVTIAMMSAIHHRQHKTLRKIDNC